VDDREFPPDRRDAVADERRARAFTLGGSLLVVLACFLPWIAFFGRWELGVQLDFVPAILVLGALSVFSAWVRAYEVVPLLCLVAFLITPLMAALSGIDTRGTHETGVGIWVALVGEFVAFVAAWFAWGARRRSRKGTPRSS
jgi:hypothetical protein